MKAARIEKQSHGGAILTWDSWEQFLDEVPSSLGAATGYVGHVGRCAFGRREVLAEMPEAMHLARNGWPEGQEALQRAMHLFVDKLSGRVPQPTYQWDVTGNQFDVAEMLTGNPEYWVEQVASDNTVESQNAKILRITWNPSNSGGTGAHRLAAVAGPVLSLAHLLEVSGRGVEIYMTYAAMNQWTKSGDRTNNGPVCELRMMVKAANQPLDLQRAAYAFGHPTLLRRIIWGVRGTGMPKGLEALGEDLCPTTPSMSGDIVVDGLHSDNRHMMIDPEGWIIARLAEQGIRLTA